MSCKNLLKKIGITMFSGAMAALSLPMITVNALIGDEKIHESSVQTRLDLGEIKNSVKSVTGPSGYDLDKLRATCTPQTVLEVATARLPQNLRYEILCNYRDFCRSAPTDQENEILISFLNSSVVRNGIINDNLI